MRVTVFGAGAVGGYLATKLAARDAAVTLVARGVTLETLKKRGLRIERSGSSRSFPIHATDLPETLPPQDLVLIAVKAHAMADAARSIARFIGRETVLVSAQNGIPWWYTFGIGGTLEGKPLTTVDPDGTISALLPPCQALGCVVHIAASMPEPGLVRHLSGERFTIGEPDGSSSARLDWVAAYLADAGIEVETTPRVRDALWVKLWGNLVFNPMSVLTRGTLLDLANDPDTLPIVRQAMSEAQAIGERIGVRFDRDIETRIEDTRIVGPHKSSTLQDFEANRPLELEALLGAGLEIGGIVGVPAPMLVALASLTRLAARSRG
jgi:2-dehydropantoate 2-reductase